MKTIKRMMVIAGLVSLSACSHSNVSGDWECPRPNGRGCITIAVADNMAMKKLEAEEPDEDAKPENNDSTEDRITSGIEDKQSSPSGKFRKVWFAPFTDSSGNWHDASVVYYQE